MKTYRERIYIIAVDMISVIINYIVSKDKEKEGY